MPSTALPFAACSPITDLAIAPIAFAPPAKNLASAIASPALTLPAPTARPNASSKPLCASGLMSATTPTPKNAISNSLPGSTTTTLLARMVASDTLHQSAALPRTVQPLEGSQLAHLQHKVKRLPHPFAFLAKGWGRWCRQLLVRLRRRQRFSTVTL